MIYDYKDTFLESSYFLALMNQLNCYLNEKNEHLMAHKQSLLGSYISEDEIVIIVHS